MKEINKYLLVLLLLVLVANSTLLIPAVLAQGLSTASLYTINDKNFVSGDIMISNGTKGITKTNVSYDAKIFGVYDEKPTIVLEASGSGKPVVRSGDVVVNVTDYNGNIAKGDLVTSSPISGKGMKAGQSGYVLGVALDKASFTNQTVNQDGKKNKIGTVLVAVKIEFAELTTARNNFALLNNLNTAFFRSVQDPEKFTLTIRYIIAGLIALLAFGIGFFTVSRSISKAVESIGRNPLARSAIISSVIFQLALAVVGAIATIAIIYIIIRI